MLRRFFLAIAIGVSSASAQPFAVPDAETARAPTSERLRLLFEAAQRDGWGPQVRPLRSAALQSYQRGNLVVAEAWFHVYAWASLFGRTDTDFTMRWVQAVNTVRVGHANMPRSLPMSGEPLGAKLSPELQKRFLEDNAFSAEFFTLLSPLDYLPSVFEILNTLYGANPERFRTYANLALAIAVVYDVPPPPNWPHGQVSAAILPRGFPKPLEAFDWWVRQDRAGRTQQPLARLRPEELKFVVDVAAPLGDLDWVLRSVDVPLADMPRVYAMVRYRVERVAANQPMWPGKSYALPEILRTGGICADQAFFACEVGKARGVPTLLFAGAGNDARHAWFGYLDQNHQWDLNAGRYAEQRFVTGIARDPQTWRELSDHELQFLSEHFHALPSYRLSCVHAEFAADMLAAGDFAGASIAARKAVNYERRNQAGWETLVEAVRQQHGNPKDVEVVMREAALAFRQYPDIEALYVARVGESLRARGQTSEADSEIRSIARKFQDTRADLSAQQARDIVLRSIATEPIEQQIRTFNQVMDTFGPGAGMSFFDQVVTVFVEHLIQLRNRTQAERAVTRAERVLGVEPRSQLEREFGLLRAKVAAIPSQ